jgi:hypothetical protein
MLTGVKVNLFRHFRVVSGMQAPTEIVYERGYYGISVTNNIAALPTCAWRNAGIETRKPRRLGRGFLHSVLDFVDQNLQAKAAVRAFPDDLATGLTVLHSGVSSIFLLPLEASDSRLRVGKDTEGGRALVHDVLACNENLH